MYLNPKNRSVSFQKRLKMFYFHHFKVFTRCRFQNVPIRVPFSKSAVFKICRQKMCRFRVNRRPIRRIFHRFQNVPASCERSLSGIKASITVACFIFEWRKSNELTLGTRLSLSCTFENSMKYVKKTFFDSCSLLECNNGAKYYQIRVLIAYYHCSHSIHRS